MAEFDPGHGVLPFPSNLALNPMTGKVALSEQCNESPTAKALRENVLNQLDGFGTFELGLQVTFSAPIDMASLTDKVVLYKRVAGGTEVSPSTATMVPVRLFPVSETQRFSKPFPTCSDPVTVTALTIVPLVPLDQKSTYTAAVLAGVKTTTGEDVGSSFTWSVIRQAQNPVTVDAQGNVVSDRTPLDPSDPAQLAQLKGLSNLWNAHAKMLAFLEGTGHMRNDILVAWEFNTQTVTDPLDPMVADSPASKIATGTLLGLQSLTANINRAAPPFVLCDPAGGGPGTDNNTQCFLKITYGGGSGAPTNQIYAAGNAICAKLGCAAVGDVIGGGLGSKNYQIAQPAIVPSPTTGPNMNNPNYGGMIPGPWSDPVNPAQEGSTIIQVLGFIPASPAPATGYPTVVFGHGLGSTKKSLVLVGPQMAAAGFASVAIDFVAHDSRAVRIRTDAECADSATGAAPDPTALNECYAPFLSPNLAVTRDNIRQTVLDLQGLARALKACGTTGCNQTVNLVVDPAHIEYAGLSLGGIIGSMAVATSPEIKSGVLNVPGVGWLDILENSNTNAIKCPLVDSLIDAGILMGDKWNLMGDANDANDTGLCTTDAWKAQPGYRQFSAIGRWVLDPADPANFTRKLAAKRILIQEVVGDQVVPNIATEDEAALVGLTPMMADPAVPPINASAAITTNPMMNKFVRYPDLPANAGTGFPGNTFAHASLLRPANGGNDGALGTARLQTDAITFLFLNK